MQHPALLALSTYYGNLARRTGTGSFLDFFHLPAALIVGDRKIALSTADDVAAVYGGLLAKYAAEDIASIDWDDDATTIIQIYPTLVLVKTVVSRSNVSGSLVKTWFCSYLMREAGGLWKCDLVTATPN
jgi:hypothetical protein